MRVRTISLAASMGLMLGGALSALVVAEHLAAALVPSDGGPRFVNRTPVVAEVGAGYVVRDPELATPMLADLKVRFDAKETAASPAALNPALESAARFLNMHARAGVSLARLKVAVVVHGAAAKDVLSNDAYRARVGTDNPNAGLLMALASAGVRVYMCGQTAGGQGIQAADLAEPTQMALSATTAHLVLDQQGYTLNP